MKVVIVHLTCKASSRSEGDQNSGLKDDTCGERCCDSIINFS